MGRAIINHLKAYRLTAGLRYDGNTIFGGKINPTAGASYTFTPWLSIKTAIGKGYKSP